MSVISQDFAGANGLKMSTLQTPAKLRMANGIIEPTFNMTHGVAISVADFREKMNAFIAPLKNYDAVIGRDMLTKWGAILDLRSQHEIDQECMRVNGGERGDLGEGQQKLDEKVWPEQGRRGISVYDKKNKTRRMLKFQDTTNHVPKRGDKNGIV